MCVNSSMIDRTFCERTTFKSYVSRTPNTFKQSPKGTKNTYLKPLLLSSHFIPRLYALVLERLLNHHHLKTLKSHIFQRGEESSDGVVDFVHRRRTRRRRRCQRPVLFSSRGNLRLRFHVREFLLSNT